MKAHILMLVLSVILMVLSAHADVESLSLGKSFYTDEEKIEFIGTEEDGNQQVSVAIKKGGSTITLLGDPSSDADGTFATIPRLVEDIFTSIGTYEAIAFTSTQKIEDGIILNLEYDGSKVAEVSQIVAPRPPQITVPEDEIVSVFVKYETEPADQELVGLGLHVHYDSTQVTVEDVTRVRRKSNILSTSSTGYAGPYNDDSNTDNDTSTNKYLVFAWAQHEYDSVNQTILPSEFFPGILAKINFRTATNFAASTTVNFHAKSTAVGYSFQTTSLTISKGDLQITQGIELHVGWNQISLNVNPANNAAESIFSDLIDENSLTKAFSKTENFDPTSTENTLTAISQGSGYWLHSDKESMLIVTGTPIETSSSIYELKRGWNHVGFVAQNPIDITTALNDLIVIGNLIRIIGEGKNFDPALPSSLNTLTQLRPDVGYWIKVKHDQDFTMP